MSLVSLLDCSENRSLSNLSYFFSTLDCPQTPPRVETTNFTPSMEDTRSFSGSSRTTLANADPSHNMQALGAKSGKCSFGQIFAKNSRRLVYSFTSVSPGLKLGIKCHGRNELDPPELPPDVVSDVPSGPDIAPGSPHFR